jgi:hypothetical protein
MTFSKHYIDKIINDNEDWYLLFIIKKENVENDFSDFSIELFVKSQILSDYKVFIPKNKYIRGSFEKELNITQERNYFFANYFKYEEKKYILEFSSNYHGIELIFNKPYCEIHEIDKNNKLGFIRYFISIQNNSYINFTIRVNHTINNEDQEPINYIFRINDRLDSIDYDNILNKEIELKALPGKIDNNANFKLTVKNGKKLINSNKSEYIYNLKIYRKEILSHEKELKTIAIIGNEQDNLIKYQEMLGGAGPNEAMTFDLSYFELKKKYIANFFIMVKTDNIENYYSRIIELETKEAEEDQKFLLLIIHISILIVVIIIIIIVYLKTRKKNKSLVEKIQSISFATGVDDSFESNKSKTDEDYDTTFI